MHRFAVDEPGTGVRVAHGTMDDSGLTPSTRVYVCVCGVDGWVSVLHPPPPSQVLPSPHMDRRRKGEGKKER